MLRFFFSPDIVLSVRERIWTAPKKDYAVQVKLKVLRGASTGKEIKIRGPHFIIGRSEECNLRANSDAISREHCQIEVTDDEVLVQDMGSKNGTFVNGEKLNGPHPVGMGDQLRVGPLEFLVTISQKAKKAQTVNANSSGTVADSEQGDDMGGMISDWLSEADEEDRKGRVAEPETREYKFDSAVEFDTAKSSTSSSVTQEMPKIDKDKLDKNKGDKSKDDKADKAKSKKKEVGKLPKQPTNNKNSTKDTQEAAAQTLRKFFNRG